MTGIALNIWIWKKTMELDVNPVTDHALADLPASQSQIDAAFKTQPWCQRVIANGKRQTRTEWREDLQKRSEQKQLSEGVIK